MLSEILAKLIIRSPVFDLPENLKESLDLDQVISWLNTSADIVILKVQNNTLDIRIPRYAFNSTLI
jgi:hypothetical protein